MPAYAVESINFMVADQSEVVKLIVFNVLCADRTSVEVQGEGVNY